MELWLLSENFEKLSVIEGYISFLWTEKYNEYGDFTIRVPEGQALTRGFQVGRYVWNSESNKLMRITRYQKDTITEGGDTETITGRSMESLYLDRVLTPNTPYGYWESAQDTATNVAHMANRNETDQDIIPRLSIEWPPAMGTTERVQIKPTSVYEAMTKELKAEDLGFSVDFELGSSRFTFKVLGGVTRENLRFMPENDNVKDLRFVVSICEEKNVAYVFHDDAPMVTVTSGGTPTGLNRRVMMVNANELDEPNLSELRKYGRDALREQNRTSLLDGEIISDMWGYNMHYRMGDLVRVRDADRNSTLARVIEYTWSHDSEGQREFPTFRTLE